MKHLSKSSLYLILISMGVVGCEDQSDVRRISTGHLMVSGGFVFAKTPPGGHETRTVSIHNVSEASVTLTEFEQLSDDSFQASWSLIGSNGKALEKAEDGLPGTIDLAAGHELRVSLTHRPTSARPPTGSIHFLSNSGIDSQRRLNVPISGVAAVGELHASPSELNFGRVAVGTSATQILTLTNLGTDQVRLEDIRVQGSSEFKVRLKQQDDSMAVTDTTAPWPRLDPRAQVEILVECLPSTERSVSGELLVTSNAHQEKVAISLRANAAAPCARFSPDSMTFPPTAIGAERRRPIRIESCGTEAVTIEEMKLLEGTEVYRFLEMPSFPRDIAGRSEQDFTAPGIDALLVFKPHIIGVQNGRAVMSTTDAQSSEHTLDIVGRGVANECPIPVITQSAITGRPLDVITLDASASRDPDGPQRKPVEYQWTVVERPDGSTAQPVEALYDELEPGRGGSADRLDTPRAQFFMDLAGEYVFELQVTDHYGASAPSELCPGDTVRLRARAVPDDTVHVQLTWDTPEDEDQTDDFGTDVDLHLLHPEANEWDTTDPLSCNYTNRNPDWGRPGYVSDDPSLDIDDVNGAGPENINLDDPEDTLGFARGYRIGAHYYAGRLGGGFDAFDDVESIVTVRVFIDGSLAHEAQKTLNATDDLWSVGEIRFDGANGRFRPDGTLTRMRP